LGSSCSCRLRLFDVKDVPAFDFLVPEELVARRAGPGRHVGDGAGIGRDHLQDLADLHAVDGFFRFDDRQGTGEVAGVKGLAG